MNTLKIGDVNLNNPFILAPMAGVTDLPFRVLCSEMGAGMNCMEMVSAKAITYNNKATWDMMKIDRRETCVSLQLFGSEPDVMAEAAKRIEELPFQIMDINMGCPVPKVVNNGEGSALMKNPVLVGRIVEAVAGAISKPLTVKIRAGFDEVAVHGRTRQQFYSGTADWEIITRVKDALSIPVIGNGDVTDGESAKRLMEETGCDGVMIGRAARGNPWIFQNIIKYFETGEVIGKPPIEEMQQMILRHCKMLVECKGEYTAVREMRQHVAWYTSGYHNSAALRRRINEAESMEELERMVCKASE